MGIVLILILVIPMASSLLCLVVGHAAARLCTAIAAIVSLGLSCAMIPSVSHGDVVIGFLRIDAISLIFLVATALVFAQTSVYAAGYLDEEREDSASRGPEAAREFALYSKRFFVGFNIFGWAMLCAPAVNGLALLWVAIEVTTVVSALLVAIDRTEGATEAAWKYVLIASCGLGIGLLATIIMYYAGSVAVGQSYDLGFLPLLQHAGALPDTAVKLSFVLAVLGFGTKVGLFPVHTWLPDAHAEAPTPVSAMLSGALLATCFYAIVRYYQVSEAAGDGRFASRVLIVFGVLSLLLAALYLLEQSDIKRLLAYSSIEHMGIIAIATGIGTPLALAGMLLHVLAHAAAKTNAFMGAGAMARVFGTKSIAEIRGAVDGLRWIAPLFGASILALSALPPFAIFRSEFEIVAGGLTGRRSQTAAVIVVVLATLAFAGLISATVRMLFQPGRPASAEASSVSTASEAEEGDALALAVWAPNRSSVLLAEPDSTPATAPSASPHGPRQQPRGTTAMTIAMAFGVLVLILLGLHPPGPLADVISRAAAEFGGAP